MRNIIKTCIITCIILIGGIVFVLSNQIGRFRTFIVSSGSMSPAIPTGAVVVTAYTHPQNLKEGDVITFLPPTKDREFVTHRITKVNQQNALTTFKTKGDNNKQEDPWTLAGGSVVGKVILSIPFIGYLFTFFQNKLVIVLCILLPAVYILLSEIHNIIKLFRHKKTKTPDSTIIGGCVLFITSIIIFTPQPSYALLTDTTSLTNNVITSQLEYIDVPVVLFEKAGD